MGTISERKGKFRAVIRKKNREMNATFSDRTTAEIWVKYHEDLIDNMENFQVPAENLITIGDCIQFKIEDLIAKNFPKRTIQDFEKCGIEFRELMDCPLGELTPDMVRDMSTKMLSSTVRRGGSRNNENSGVIGVSSPATVLRKLRVLASAISFMIEKGANITNAAQIVVNQVKMSIIKKGEDLED